MPGRIGRHGTDCRTGRTTASVRRWTTGVSVALLLQGFTAACEYPFGPDDGDVLPELTRIGFDDLGTFLSDGGIVWLRGVPSDTSFRLQRNQRVPVRLSASSGDQEEVGLYRLDCPARDGGYVYRCFEFSITYAEVYDIAEIERRVAAIGGRFQIRSRSFASIVLFDDPDKVMRLAREAGSWPGVAFPWFSAVGCLPTGCSTQFNFLSLPVRVDHGSPIPGDGILQVSPGDTLRFTYTQPTGQTLEATTIRVPQS